MNNMNIEKPATIIAKELNENIAAQINKSGLPFFVVAYILKDILNEVYAVSQKQLEADTKNYQKKLEETNKEENKEVETIEPTE